MYIKLKNGIIDKYPYSIGQLYSDNPDVSFPETIPEATLKEYEVFKVKEVAKPTVDYTENLNEDIPKFIKNEWVQVWEVTPASDEEILQRILDLRAAEYPPMQDYLDGIVKGDQAQIDKYIADCLAVKAKYPKP